MSTEVIKTKLLDSLINGSLSYRDIDKWRNHFLPDLYVLPDDRAILAHVLHDVLANAEGASDIYNAWLKIWTIETCFSMDIQAMYEGRYR